MLTLSTVMHSVFVTDAVSQHLGYRLPLWDDGSVRSAPTDWLLGGMKETLAFAIAGAIAGNLYRECEAWALTRRQMTETA